MKTALINSVRVAGVHTFGWKWRSEDGTAGCRDTFMYFNDCAEDAKRHGYQARFAGADLAGPTSPAAQAGAQRVRSDRPSR